MMLSASASVLEKVSVHMQLQPRECACLLQVAPLNTGHRIESTFPYSNAAMDEMNIPTLYVHMNP